MKIYLKFNMKTYLKFSSKNGVGGKFHPRGLGTHPCVSGHPLPAGTLAGRGASNDLNLNLKDMTLNHLTLKEFGFQLMGKMEVFSKVFACADAT